MNSESIREQQSKLKDQYRDKPESAIHSMTVTGEVTQPDYTIKLPTHIGDVVAGLHTAAGGDGSHACSGDMCSRR